MYTELISDPKLYFAFLKFDEELANECWLTPCPHCGDKLNQAHYQRKPRGGPMAPEQATRFSFCCRAKGCRRRTNPPSIRFLGRKVYLGVLVTLMTAMAHGLSASRVAKVHNEIGVSRQTLRRWRRWWLDHVPQTTLWKEARGRFQRPIDSSALPNSLVTYFKFSQMDLEQAIIRLLTFIMPLGTTEK